MQRSQVLIFILAVLSQSRAESQGNCTTPNGRNGECISVRACRMLYSCIQRPQMTQNATEFLRRSRCGTANDGYPAVCCEIDYYPSTTNKARNPCYPEVFMSDKLPSDCGYEEDMPVRIFGGEQSYPTEYPWVVLIEYDTPRGLRTFCGGSLISNRYVITAAHCVQPTNRSKWSVKSVRLGEYDTDSDPDCSTEKCFPSFISIPIVKIIIHGNFTPYNGFDIALLKLATPVTFSPTVRPICLPGTSDNPPSFITAGWGETETSRSSNIKLKVQVPLVSLNECQAALTEHNVTLLHRHLCAGTGGKRGKDACRGDSGGPLMAGVTNLEGHGRWTIFGIVSFGIGKCGARESRGIYTKVSSHINWIIINMT